MLGDTLARLPLVADSRLLVGFGTSDDAAVYRLGDDLALVQTVDFFTPIVDDPYWFGRIAASNALSDVYAMGGHPLTAMNIVCFPEKTLGMDVLDRILRGGLDAINEAGATLVGGHTVSDPEPKYGLAVTGTIHPDEVISNGGARPGDLLVLTKPIGTGILCTAHKRGELPDEKLEPVVKVMAALNRAAAGAMRTLGVRGATDVTGFGLLGHALELARASNVTLEIHANRVPLLQGTLEYIERGTVPGGTKKNRKHALPHATVSPAVPDPLLLALCDAQTSGGLLIAVPGDRAHDIASAFEKAGHLEHAVIGQVTERGETPLVVVPGGKDEAMF